ncbi:histidine ammonia-lyase-like [Salmo trutta]|uniref:histidine ammonia-lyase-like n=1 Tax=Salmo trutta TaxID=8032 RepID=UPI00113259B5|nr:histidine ammonia-lyase-like [Salmo trutta]
MELQANLIRSHSAVGPPLSVERTRMLLALRINVLAKGYSGVSMETVQAMVKAFIASCLSWVCDGSLPLLPQPPACRGCVTDLSLYSPSLLPVVGV